MPIYPLPQFEADLKAQLDEADRAEYEALKTPKTLVVRFGALKMVGEFPYAGNVKPGCGSKIVVRTFRGTEIGEMLTSTCPNSGCGKSVSRKEMLQYISNSGGRDYPFFSDGRALRVAEMADMDKQAQLEQSRHALRLQVRDMAERLGVKVRITDVEPILGGETLTVYYLSEERVELRDLIRELSLLFKTRVDLRHVGARDEARLVADYEKCGQYCCCKNFLKVLKPVSMKSAKVQKATLDPLKISGRCGRLMCCLRYEDSTYEDLRKKLPRRKSRVGTPEGDGIVIDSQILTQLVLVSLDEPGTDGKPREVAIPVEELTAPTNAAPVRRDPPMEGRDGRPPRDGMRDGPRDGRPRREGVQDGPREGSRDGQRDQRGPRPQRPPQPPQRPAPQPVAPADQEDANDVDDLGEDAPIQPDSVNGEGSGPSLDGAPRPPRGPGQGNKRRRRRRRSGPGPGPGQGPGQGSGGPGGGRPQGGPPAP
ncbi:MAG TPA: regulatory iron-sulfur-containing complex subunit RicT [Phycisphaerales bacterium]|nr:regulatory iron-sulfur-containing complex subunit RicT [Phycisphaerales bacterium]